MYRRVIEVKRIASDRNYWSPFRPKRRYSKSFTYVLILARYLEIICTTNVFTIIALIDEYEIVSSLRQFTSAQVIKIHSFCLFFYIYKRKIAGCHIKSIIFNKLFMNQ